MGDRPTAIRSQASTTHGGSVLRRVVGGSGVLGLLLLITLDASAYQALTEPRPTPGNPAPEYPEEARRASITGPVLFAATVDAAGRVKAVRILRVPREDFGFEKAVMKAVERWHFEPARRGAEPTPGQFVGRVSFQLNPRLEERVRQFVERSAELWEARDASGLVHLVAADGELRGHDGERVGEKDLRVALSRFWGSASGALDGGVALVGIQTFPNVAVVRVDVDADLGDPSRQDDVATRWTAFLRTGRELRVLSFAPFRPGPPVWTPPVAIEPVKPAYPLSAGDIEGLIVVEGILGADGRFTRPRILRSIPSLDPAVLEAIEAAAWKPARVEGLPVEVVMTLEIYLSRRKSSVDEKLPPLFR